MSHHKRIMQLLLMIAFLAATATTSVLSQADLDYYALLPRISRNLLGFQVTWATVTRIIDSDTLQIESGQ